MQLGSSRRKFTQVVELLEVRSELGLSIDHTHTICTDFILKGTFFSRISTD